jgi:hypothetical protein
MAAKQPLTKDLAKALHAFYVRMPIEGILQAIDDGKRVELTESTFTDLTDFCSVQIDGVTVFHADGY